jgi:hypothetical protein
MKQLLRPLILATVLAISSLSMAFAQSSGVKPDFPTPTGPTNAGRDFWLSFPTNWDVPSATTKYVRLYITAGTKTKVDVWVGPTLLKTVYTIPYDFVTVDLSSNDGEAIVRDDQSPVPPDQVYTNHAVHVQAEAPIVVYGMNRTSFTTDGILALPTNALGREYIVSSAADIADGKIQKLPSQYLVIAPYDATTVTIIHPMDSPNHPADQPFSFTMNKGDVFSAMSVGPLGDLTGTWIRASKPVAVTAGQNCTYLPDFRYCCCDHLEEMLLPVSSWGKFYHSIPYAQRIKGDMFRIFAAEPDTKVYINGNLYGTIGSKGGQNGAGWFEYLPPDRNLIEFSSDKPIAVAQYNNSQQYDNTQTDPFYCVLTPVEQYQTQLVFTTPTTDYVKNFVNVVCDSAGYYALEIATGSSTTWEKVSQKFGASLVKKFQSQINGKTYVGTTLEIAPGTYRMRGPQPFAGYIYGFSAYDSYGYPLSVAVGDLSVKDTVAPDITIKVDCDGNVTGSTNDYPDPDNERSNLSTIELDEGSVNYAIDPLPVNFQPGLSRATTFKLHVVDKTKDAVAYLVISDMAGNISRDTIRYAAFNVVVEPTPLAFGSYIVGASDEKTVTIKNLSATPVDIKEARLKLKNQGFTLIEPVGPFTLGPVGSPTANVTAKIHFDATAAGKFADSLGLEDACGFRNMALVTATVGSPIIKVSDMDWEATYGPTEVGKKAPTGLITVRNAATDGGVLTVHVPAIGPTIAVFTAPDGLPTAEFDLAPGESKQIRVDFQPTAPQKYLDSIVFSNNAPPNPANDSVGLLIGRGVTPGLAVTPMPWPRYRVGTGPWPGTVKLTNTGTSALTIHGILKTTGDVSDFQVVDPTQLNTTIAAGASVTVDVTFSPTAIGNRSMNLYYSTDLDGEYYSVLSGIGIIPRLVTEDVDFGTMKVGDPAVERPARFIVPNDPDTFTDSLKITGIRFRGTDGDFSSLPIDTALTLQPGDTLALRGFFAATTPGTHTTTIAAITPDPLGPTSTGVAPDTVSAWKGVGTAEAGEIEVTAQPVSICVGDTALITVHITNPGTEPVTVSGVTLDGVGSGDFTILDATTQFTVDPGASRDVTVRFVATKLGEEKPTVTVQSSAKTPEVTVDLSGTGFQKTVASVTELRGNKGTVADLSSTITATVSLSDGFPTGTDVGDYQVTFNYDPALFAPETNSAKYVVGGANPSAVATYDQAASSRGKLVVDVTTTTPVNPPGSLLTVPFAVVFDSTLKRSISADVVFNGKAGKCVSATSIPGSIDIAPICGLSLRMIEMTGAKYALGQNTPNPGRSSTTITYSLGLDGHTTMVLYDMQGNAVQTLINQQQQPGGYELTIDATNLPSGSYYYKLTSGAWSETKRLDIAK